MIITIDGPAGSGKSSIAKQLSEKLNFGHLNTGLMYRAYTFGLKELGLTKKSECFSCINFSTTEMKNLEKVKIKFENNQLQAYFHDQNITKQLYNSKLGILTAKVSKNPQLRQLILEMQRNIASTNNVVVEGRDSGTTVFPNAETKFFLTASVEVRAKRIFQDPNRSGNTSLAQVTEELQERDKEDKTRKHAPLVVPKDAIIIDTSNMSMPQVLETMLTKINNHP